MIKRPTKKDYHALIYALLYFIEINGKMPSCNQNSTSKEIKLYHQWYKLYRGKIYKQFFTIADRNKLLSAGYGSLKKQQYEKLKFRVFDFVNTFGREPKMKAYKNLQSINEREEYRLAKCLYDLRNGNTYIDQLTTIEIEEFEQAGIDMKL